MFVCFFIFCCFFPLNLTAQQEYFGNDSFGCPHRFQNQDQTSPSPTFLYTCNGQNSSCQAFLIFRSQSPYNSVPSISNLTSSDPLEIARINNSSISANFTENKEVIIPVNCSCLGKNYQANSSYVIAHTNTYFIIATSIYQNLSTCNSLLDQNSYDPLNLPVGLEIRVPLRCACPTIEQTRNGVRYLLTYITSSGDNVPGLSQRFNVTERSVLDANGFSNQEDPILFPFTAFLIPLHSEPSSSQTRTPVLPFTPANKRSIKWVYVGTGITAGAFVSILFAVFSCIIFHRRKTDRIAREEGPVGFDRTNKNWVLPDDLVAAMANVDRGLKVFCFEDLLAGTNNFSAEFKIKGSVYRGTIDNQLLAIKKMSKDATEEVNILNKINHFNLIKLHGLCFDRENCYLIYEFMENGSLKDCLRSKTSSRVLNWTQRVQIALDVANGLQYLHSYMEPTYVHKDIKSSNLLLNCDLRAKIANFNLTRSEKDGEFALTANVVGTKGYMAPEYLQTGLVTTMLDVYAFGVVILELISGKNVIIKLNEGEMFLAEAAIAIMEGENAEYELSDFMDPNLQGRYPKDLALGLARLSISCLDKNPATRLSMSKILSCLSIILLESKNWESSSYKQSGLENFHVRGIK